MGGKRFSTFAWGVLTYAMAVILWGYFLRISESGDGCGTDWPLCSGELVPAGAGFPTWVEFTHRASSGLTLILVVVLASLAVRSFGRGHPVRRAALASLLLTVTESLFGAILVVFGWVAGDVSVGRVLIRPFHVTNTFLLMGALGLTAWWASRRVDRTTSLGKPESRRFRAAGAGLLALAATGSWAGLAGTAFPAETVLAGLTQYLDPEHLLVYLRTAHPLVAVLALVLLVRDVTPAGGGSGGAAPHPRGLAARGGPAGRRRTDRRAPASHGSSAPAHRPRGPALAGYPLPLVHACGADGRGGRTRRGSGEASWRRVMIPEAATAATSPCVRRPPAAPLQSA